MASDLISREAARDVINTWGRHENENVRMDLLHNDINAIPAVDAAPVVHAVWLDTDTSYADGPQDCRCSACGVRSLRPLGEYCRWCGAKMDGGDT